MFYNCRLKIFENGQKQITFYSRKLEKNVKHSNLTKVVNNHLQTEKEKNHSMKVSRNRSKNKIYDIARSNIWEYFITLTFDQKLYESDNYNVISKNLTMFLNNLRRSYAPNLRYLIVPELHSDGLHYHFHGLISHVGDIKFVYSGLVTINGLKIYNLPQWNYGFTTATEVLSNEKICHYITKYVTKNLDKSLKEKHRYFASRNIPKVQEKFTLEMKQLLLDKIDKDIKNISSVKNPNTGMICTYYEL